MAKRTFIMVVDDDPGFVELLRKVLRQHGYTVMLATDGDTALKMSRYHSGHIDLLLTDVIMPTMSGPTLAQKLLAQRPHTQVLFMSGMTNAAAIPMELRDRSTFVEKHPPLDGLVQTVQKVLQDS